ncbi:ABC transporter permease [Phytomonospora endophytica]|uniref:Putative ABC transport system permease protein n=1 Tax=Phytomonospora endophytica TaxID=714109 RepID=A0A841FG53_9ACTN|nr:ABC transporter permease [Phytomonospora endophytica]MBB6034595.1 putative ABC transport system permease protein [Phytomonospora endophytica]GIG71345.1 ABC transporter substrate-binding protein [Phytomonospora endophytica]
MPKLPPSFRLAWAHALRQSLTALAVIIGVAFIAATFIVTDGARDAMNTQTSGQYRGSAAAVFDEEGFTGAALDRIRATPGVAAVAGAVFGPGAIRSTASQSARLPEIGWLSAVQSAPFQPFDVVSGRLPGAGEAVIDAATAESNGYVLGSALAASAGDNRPTSTYTLVGTIDTEGTRFADRPMVGLSPDDALAAFGQDSFDRLLVAASPGTSPDTLVAALKTSLGADADILTHDEIVDLELRDAYRNLDIIRAGLFLFALIAVLTAGFVIANTFTIVLAQRGRQLALLRLVGSSRAQIFRGVLLEAGLVGGGASLLGLAAGIGVAAGLRAVLTGLGTSFGGAFVIEPRTLVVAFVTGVLVTTGSAALPAWRGTRVPPIAALAETATEVARPIGRARIASGVLLLAAAVASLALPASIPQVALIGILGFFGLVALGPAYIPALARVVGWPVARLGGWARLAVVYSARNRRRVAATTTTLVLCVSLVSAVMIGAKSIEAGIDAEMATSFPADFTVNGAVPAELVSELAARPELGTVLAQRSGEVDGTVVQTGDPAILDQANPRPKEGFPGDLRDGTVVVTGDFGGHVGDTLRLRGHDFTVVAVLTEPGDFAVFTEADARLLLPDAPVTALMITASGSLEEASAVVRDAIAAHPALSLMDVDAYRDARTAGLDRLLAAVIALLALAALIALVGIANTLSLSVVERAREHGVLRALGVGRRGVRGMLAVEAMLVAVVGAVLGLGLGLWVAWAAVEALKADGPVTLTVPAGQVAGVLGTVVLAALAASVLPARRAVRAPIVDALSRE